MINSFQIKHVMSLNSNFKSIQNLTFAPVKNNNCIVGPVNIVRFVQSHFERNDSVFDDGLSIWVCDQVLSIDIRSFTPELE